MLCSEFGYHRAHEQTQFINEISIWNDKTYNNKWNEMKLTFS